VLQIYSTKYTESSFNPIQ